MEMSAQLFINELETLSKNMELIPKIERFSLAKKYMEMPIFEVEVLLRTDNHDNRVGAVAILDWKARNKKTSSEERKAIFNVYINNHNWIDDWGLVDRAAPYVVGGYLFDKDRSLLYQLAKSPNPMERRTAIVSTYYFIRQKQVEDTFSIAEILINDTDIYVQKAVGSWVREAGKYDMKSLLKFLDNYAKTMPRVTLQYAIEKLDRNIKDHYFGMKRKKHSELENK